MSNNFVEIHRKIGENVGSYSKEFLIPIPIGTRSEEFFFNPFRGNSHNSISKEFLVTNSRKFLVTNSAEKSEKMSTKFVEILWNFQRKFVGTNSRDFPGNIFPRFSQVEFLRNILKYSQHIPE